MRELTKEEIDYIVELFDISVDRNLAEHKFYRDLSKIGYSFSKEDVATRVTQHFTTDGRLVVTIGRAADHRYNRADVYTMADVDAAYECIICNLKRSAIVKLNDNIPDDEIDRLFKLVTEKINYICTC